MKKQWMSYPSQHDIMIISINIFNKEREIVRVTQGHFRAVPNQGDYIHLSKSLSYRVTNINHFPIATGSEGDPNIEINVEQIYKGGESDD